MAEKINYLFFADLHIKESELEECSLVLDEIVQLCKKLKITRVFNLGDTFDNTRPTSKELDLFSSFIKKIDTPITIIAADSHESSTSEDSIVNHFGILNNKIEIVKEYKDENKLFCGHFGLKEATLTKFGATHSQKEFSEINWVILGHFHSYEKINPNCIQLGSVRWIDFAEIGDKKKVIWIIEDYNGTQPRCGFITLKSPYSMISLELRQNSENKTISDPTKAEIVSPTQPERKIQEEKEYIGQLLAKLDKIDPKTKVRVVFKDYSSWVGFLPYYQKYKDKFVLFKDKKDFIISLDKQIEKKENENLKEMLNTWLEKNKIDEKIQKILKEKI